MTPESYNKATPLIKELDAVKHQIATTKTATTIKVEMSGVPIGFNIATVGEENLSKLRKTIMDVLENQKAKFEKELADL